MEGVDEGKLLGMTPQRRITRRLFLFVEISSVIVFVVLNLGLGDIAFGDDPLGTHFAKCAVLLFLSLPIVSVCLLAWEEEQKRALVGGITFVLFIVIFLARAFRP